MPATFGPIAGMRGFTRPLVLSETNFWTTRAAIGTADTPAALESALAEAKSRRGGPVAIVVEVNPEPSVPDYDSWWDVPVAEVSTSPRVQAARREYEENLKRERSFV